MGQEIEPATPRPQGVPHSTPLQNLCINGVFLSADSARRFRADTLLEETDERLFWAGKYGTFTARREAELVAIFTTEIETDGEASVPINVHICPEGKVYGKDVDVWLLDQVLSYGVASLERRNQGDGI